MISFNELYPQSVLKHSVDQFKGIGMKFIIFFDFFWSKFGSKMTFLSINYVHNQV